MHLRPRGNNQRGYNLLYLQTNKVINRAHITPTPANKLIIRWVHILAVKDKMPKSLKIMNRADVTLYNSAQTARVDYEDKDNEYDDHKEH